MDGKNIYEVMVLDFMNFSTFCALVKADHARLNRVRGGMLRHLFLHPSFKITFWFRLASYTKSSGNLFCRILYPLTYMIYRHYSFLLGIQIPVGARIGGGVVFPHHGLIVVDSSAIIGDNCTIFHDVTIGRTLGQQGEAV